MCIIGILWVITAAIAAYYEIDRSAFYQSMKSFRGFCIIVAIITDILCDIARHILRSQEKESLLVMIIDDLCFFVVIMIMLSADSAPRITNFVRFLGPLICIIGLSGYVVRYK